MTNDKNFKALSDGTRRNILDLLEQKGMTAGEIAEHCGTSKPNISQHLNVLKEAELVEEERQGKYIYYSLKKQKVRETKKELSPILSIKEKILREIQEVVNGKKCDTVMGTESHDNGTLFIRKNNKNVFVFHYSFRLNSFVIQAENPFPVQEFYMSYDDDKLKEFLTLLKTELEQFQNKEEKKEKIRKKLLSHLIHNEHELEYYLLDYKNDNAVKKIVDFIGDEISDYLFSSSKQNFSAAEKENMLYKFAEDFTYFGMFKPYVVDDDIQEIRIHSKSGIQLTYKDGTKEQHDLEGISEEEIIDDIQMICTISNKDFCRTDFTNKTLRNNMHISILSSLNGYTAVLSKEKKPHTILEQTCNIPEELHSFFETLFLTNAKVLISGEFGVDKREFFSELLSFFPLEQPIVFAGEHKQTFSGGHHIVSFDEKSNHQEPMEKELHRSIMLDPSWYIFDSYKQTNMLFEFSCRPKIAQKGFIFSTVAGTEEAAFSLFKMYLSEHIKHVLPFDYFDVVIQLKKDLKNNICYISSISKPDKEKEVFVPMYTKEERIDIDKKEVSDMFETILPSTYVTLSEKEFLIELMYIVQLWENTLSSGIRFSETLGVLSRFAIEPFRSVFGEMYVLEQSGAPIEMVMRLFSEKLQSPYAELLAKLIVSYKKEDDTFGLFFSHFSKMIQSYVEVCETTSFKEQYDKRICLLFFNCLFFMNLKHVDFKKAFKETVHLYEDGIFLLCQEAMRLHIDFNDALRHIIKHTNNRYLLLFASSILHLYLQNGEDCSESIILRKNRDLILSSLK